jgi:ParB/RepB/Spo0J family partition protein
MMAAKKSVQPTVVSEQPLPTELRDIAIEELVASPNNPRRTMVGLEELEASIRESGITVPLLVRPVRSVTVTFADGSSEQTPYQSREKCSELLLREGGVEKSVDDCYEIVAGHRRREAAMTIGLSVLPCIVRELTDEEAAEIAFVDNAQRVGVDPVEEAEALGKLLERLLTIAAVALKVGKEQSYVAKRLKLLSLTTWSREALRKKLITIDHAMLLARLAEAEQNEALKWCLDPQAGKKTAVFDVVKDRIKRKNPAAAKAAIAADSNGEEDADEGDDFEDDDELDGVRRRPAWSHVWECESVQRLKEHIECSSGEVLDRAPWPMEEDWLLPDAGSCLDCEKNTKVNTPLFGDLDTGVAVCTDGACFKAKTGGFVLHGIETVKKTAGAVGVLRVSWKSTSTAPRLVHSDPGKNIAPDIPLQTQVFKDGQWVETKKKCEHARTAVTVDWGDANNRGYMGGGETLRKPGEILQVCVMPKCKVHTKAYEKTASAVKGEKNEAEKKAQAAREMEKFNAFKAAEKPVREALYLRIETCMKPEAVKRYLLAKAIDWNARRALCWAAGFESDDYNKQQAYLKQHIEQTPAPRLDELLFGASFGNLLVIDASAMRSKDRGRAGLRELAKLVGVDAAAIERKLDKPVAKPVPKKAAKPAPKKVAKKTANRGAKQ